MAVKGSLSFQMKGRYRQALTDFDYPISELDDFIELDDKVDAGLEDLQDQIDDIIAGTAGVISFNERIGDVVAEDGDYTAAQVGADPAGAAASVAALLAVHTANMADPHGTLAALQTFIASNLVAQEDNDAAVTVINGADIFLNLEISQTYDALDVVSFHVELPDVLGAAGNSEVLFELIYDKGGAGEAVIASEQLRVGNTQTTMSMDIKAIVAAPVALGTVGLYGTAVNGNTTVDGSGARDNYLLAERTRNFSFKAYAP